LARGLERGEVRQYKFAAPNKSRPVLILTRSTAIRYLSRVTVAPITSTVRGVPSEVVLGIEDGMKTTCAVNLHNLITVGQKGLGRRLTQLSENKMKEICAAIAFSLECEG
jgi:mRNA interferase MazF